MKNLEHTLIKKVQSALCEIFPDAKGELSEKKILVGISGGADSVSLLYALDFLRDIYGYTLVACHINHMIRGKEADSDELFAKALCEKLNIPFESFRIDVPTLSEKSGKGLEEAARDARYEAFISLSESLGVSYIATAHNSCDNAETVLMNITRGCGISGLCGIPLMRGNIIRPLLFVTRPEIEDFLSVIGQDFVTDSTNLIPDCTRNKIRLEVIPTLREINGAFYDSVSNMCSLLKRENDFLEKLSLQYYTDDICELSKLDKVLSSRIIGKMYKDFKGTALDMLHIDLLVSEMQRSVFEKDNSRKLYNLPGGVCAVFENGKIFFCSTESTKNNDKNSDSYDICLKWGKNIICDGKYIVCMTLHNKTPETECEFSDCYHDIDTNIYSLFMEVRLFSDIIKGKICARSALSGDKIRKGNMSKSIRKILSVNKLSLSERFLLPRFYDSGTGDIVALPTLGVCDTHNTKHKSGDITLRLYQKCTKE